MLALAATQYVHRHGRDVAKKFFVSGHELLRRMNRKCNGRRDRTTAPIEQIEDVVVVRVLVDIALLAADQQVRHEMLEPPPGIKRRVAGKIGDRRGIIFLS